VVGLNKLEWGKKKLKMPKNTRGKKLKEMWRGWSGET